ncbi:MAG: 50S ribosomal protein L11 methyltransferase [Bradyrhizobiaceae bacterium]|nr:MAG: 50S ribosomal protein L11 methyltransferase [Bradyrhizobiaceae bacterium]
MAPSATPSSPTHHATCSAGSEASANRIVDVLSEIFDGGEVVVSAFERPGSSEWDVSLYFETQPDQAAIRAMVAQTVGDETAATLVFDTVEAKDWVKASLADLVPVRAGRFVVHGQHDRDRIPPNKLRIEIEAALAFGTGHHGTTRGCLMLLDRVVCQSTPRRVLDLGTGTGVLAIAAAKALHRSILASDIDPRSVVVAKENAVLNGVGRDVEAIHAIGFGSPRFAETGPFDLVLANILANPLRQLAAPMVQHLAPSAFVILSGLLPPHARGVIAAYRGQGLRLIRRYELDGWVSLLMQRIA